MTLSLCTALKVPHWWLLPTPLAVWKANLGVDFLCSVLFCLNSIPKWDSTCWPSPVSRERSCSWFRRYLLSVKNLSVVKSEREFHWGFCNYIFLIWYILSIYCVKPETSYLVLIYRGLMENRNIPFWRGRVILQGGVVHLLNQSESLEQFGFFCCFIVVWVFVLFLFFFFPSTALPCSERKTLEGRILDIHSLEEQEGWEGRVDGLTDATVLHSLNLGMVQTGKAVPGMVLYIHAGFCPLQYQNLSKALRLLLYPVPSHLQSHHPTRHLEWGRK